MRLDQLQLRRPIVRWVGEKRIPACLLCQESVAGTLGAPAVPRRRLGGKAIRRVDADVINVRGFVCEDCSYVLAIAPEHANVNVHDPATHERGEPIAEPWCRVGAYFADGTERAIVVPTQEVQP